MSNSDPKLDAFFTKHHLIQCIDKVERLQGGLLNFSFRIYFNNEIPKILPENSNNHNFLTLLRQLKPKSLVAKVGYPYFVQVKAHVPFPLSRQNNESKGSQLFYGVASQIGDVKSNSVDLSSVLSRNKTIKISHIWFHDEENNVLIMDDQGTLPSMQEWFSSKQSSSTKPILDIAEAYGQQMANFVVDMQVSSLSYVKDIAQLLKTDELVEFEKSAFPSMIENMRNNYSVPDADELSLIFTQYFEHVMSCTPTDGQVLGQGDFWPPNFLVDERNSTLAIIDWECAGLRSPAYDPCTLCARCRIQLILDPSNECMLHFVNAFMDSYRDNAKQNKVSWYENDQQKYRFSWELGVRFGFTLMLWMTHLACCPTEEGICSHQRAFAAESSNYLRRCRPGPGKATYDSISRDKFLGRLF